MFLLCCVTVYPSGCAISCEPSAVCCSLCDVHIWRKHEQGIYIYIYKCESPPHYYIFRPDNFLDMEMSGIDNLLISSNLCSFSSRNDMRRKCTKFTTNDSLIRSVSLHRSVHRDWLTLDNVPFNYRIQEGSYAAHP